MIVYRKNAKEIIFRQSYQKHSQAKEWYEFLITMFEEINKGSSFEDEETGEKKEFAPLTFNYSLDKPNDVADQFFVERNIIDLKEHENIIANSLKGAVFTCREHEIGKLSKVDYPSITFSIMKENMNVVESLISEGLLNSVSTDMNGDSEKVNRLRESFDFITENPDQLRNPKLAIYLFDASKATPSTKERIQKRVEIINENRLNKNLNESQVEAIAKAVEAKDMVSNRQCETGRYDMKKAEKMNVSDRVMVLEYIGKHFSDYTEPGKGDLTYEMEYILCGKDTDKKNLESSIERLMRMREAANVAHIIADREKLNQTLMIATSLAGFSGNPAVVKIVQIGVVAAWAYVESILDLRTLLSGGKISLIKSAAEWTTDLKKLGEIVTGEGKARECKNGLSYQAYIKQLLFAMKEKKMAYRMMDIMELAMQKEQNGKNARMDHMIDNMICELRFEAKPLFAKRSLYGDMEMGGYTFFKRQKLSYINK